MDSKLIILGAGGCGREVMQWALAYANQHNDVQPIGFLDDNPKALHGMISDLPVLGSIQAWQPKVDQLFVCGIAAPEAKRTIVAMMKARGARFYTLIHPTAIIATTATIGEGVVVSPFSVVSDNAAVGDFAFLNMHTSVGHNARVGDFSTISSYCDITGGVSLGQEVFLGSHVSVVPGVTVGDRAYLCAGSVVMNNIKADMKVLGNPARKFSL